MGLPLVAVARILERRFGHFIPLIARDMVHGPPAQGHLQALNALNASNKYLKIFQSVFSQRNF